jgi:transposase
MEQKLSWLIGGIHLHSMCQECQHIQPMKLSERVFKCSKCGVSQDRDANAAINLERAPDSKVLLMLSRN